MSIVSIEMQPLLNLVLRLNFVVNECRLVNVVVKVMSDVFPELKRNEEHIRETIAAEEASFGKTLLKVRMGFV